MEIAYVASNKLRIELENKQGGTSAAILSALTKNPSRFITTMLVGNNIALVVYAYYMAEILEPIILSFNANEAWVLFFQTLLTTLLILVTAEFLPKAIFRLYANNLLSFFALPVLLIYYVLYPVVVVMTGLSNYMLRILFRSDVSDEHVNFSRVDLDDYVRQHADEGVDKEEQDSEIQIFQNALDFSKVKARECMLPRADIVAIDVNASIDELREEFIRSGLSKILVHEEGIDNVIGYIHSYELFKKPENIRSILIPIQIVTESLPAHELLSFFIKEHRSIALVIDEFGGTAGLVTIEDVIEEIFGEIEDEHDTIDTHELRISENVFQFSARLEVDHLNEKYQFALPESEQYETLGGFIVNANESIPSVGDFIEVEGFEFEILSGSETRIETVKLTLKPNE
ncbi:MAG: putative hemolysin [Candidatus Azotimanducaceae bacterium]|jgi:putative hemolysin